MHVKNRLLCAAALTLVAQWAGAAVLQTLGAGTAVGTVTNAAYFDLNTALANDWVEDGLLFHASGYGANNGCGYAGVDCYDAVSELSPAFSGNYFATSGTNAYISVRTSPPLNSPYRLNAAYAPLGGQTVSRRPVPKWAGACARRAKDTPST